MTLALHAEAPGGEGPPLALVHGFMHSRLNWRINLPALRRAASPILIDLPAHGLSPPPTPEDAAPDALVAAIDAVRERFGFASWHVCGHSFGAALSIRLALAHPQTVRSLTILNSGTAFAAPLDAAGEAAQEARARRTETEGPIEMRRRPQHPANAPGWPADVQAELIAEADRVDPAGAAALIRHALPHVASADRLGELTMPVLLANGRLEAGFQPHRDRLARVVPHAAIVDLEAHHGVNIEDAAGFDAAIVPFLKRAEAAWQAG